MTDTCTADEYKQLLSKLKSHNMTVRTITLTEAEYNELLSELRALEIYRWNDERILAAASPSKLLPVIERRAFITAPAEKPQQEPIPDNSPMFKPDPAQLSAVKNTYLAAELCRYYRPVAPGVTVNVKEPDAKNE